MSVDTNIPNLVINKLTKQQYEGTTPSATELYFITDEDSYLATNQGSVNAGKVLTVGNDGTVTPETISGGTTDYVDLINKPQINGYTLSGDKTAANLGFAAVSTSGSYTDLVNVPTFATVATSGDYDDLTNKPTIPAAQQQTDWNAVSGITSIANKPSLATVATSGSYADLSNTPTIPVVVQDFWVDSTTGAITCTFSETPTTKSVHTIIGNTTIAGTWSNNVFTPTTADDILNNVNGFVVAVA